MNNPHENIQTIIDFCRNCHIVTHLQFYRGKGFCCPRCSCPHNLSQSVIPILVNGSNIDHNKGMEIKKEAHYASSND